MKSFESKAGLFGSPRRYLGCSQTRMVVAADVRRLRVDDAAGRLGTGGAAGAEVLPGKPSLRRRSNRSLQSDVVRCHVPCGARATPPNAAAELGCWTASPSMADGATGAREEVRLQGRHLRGRRRSLAGDWQGGVAEIHVRGLTVDDSWSVRWASRVPGPEVWPGRGPLRSSPTGRCNRTSPAVMSVAEQQPRQRRSR